MRLIVLRHAKSDWNAGAATDHERPLNARGQRDAPRVGAALLRRGWVPDVLLSSDAQRTRETWQHMRPFLAPDLPGQFLPSLYHAGMATVSPLLVRQTASTVLILGHNPGMERVVATLTDSNPVLTTCNAVLLESTATRWSDALRQSWTLVDILRPKELL